MLQQYIDKEIIELSFLIKSTATNVLQKHWDIVFMDWSYLMHMIEDYQIIVTLLKDKWVNILNQAEWENANYKNVYDNLDNLDHEDSEKALENYQQMIKESKWIEQMLFFLKKIIHWLNNLNALAKNDGEICNISQIFIIFFGYKKGNQNDNYLYDDLVREMQFFYKFTSELVEFCRAKTNLYYIYPYVG